jgi:hypothetical protein
MDGNRFDRLVRMGVGDRRDVLRGLLGSAQVAWWLVWSQSGEVVTAGERPDERLQDRTQQRNRQQRNKHSYHNNTKNKRKHKHTEPQGTTNNSNTNESSTNPSAGAGRGGQGGAGLPKPVLRCGCAVLGGLR